MADILDRILHKLPGDDDEGKSETRVMTVRMPATLHAALKDEARARKTSANKLAVAKLSVKAESLDKVAVLVQRENT